MVVLGRTSTACCKCVPCLPSVMAGNLRILKDALLQALDLKSVKKNGELVAGRLVACILSIESAVRMYRRRGPAEKKILTSRKPTASRDLAAWSMACHDSYGSLGPLGEEPAPVSIPYHVAENAEGDER